MSVSPESIVCWGFSVAQSLLLKGLNDWRSTFYSSWQLIRWEYDHHLRRAFYYIAATSLCVGCSGHCRSRANQSSRLEPISAVPARYRPLTVEMYKSYALAFQSHSISPRQPHCVINKHCVQRASQQRPGGIGCYWLQMALHGSEPQSAPEGSQRTPERNSNGFTYHPLNFVRPSPRGRALVPALVQPLHHGLARNSPKRQIGFDMVRSTIHMTLVGLEPTPFRNGALSHRLRPLGQSVHAYLF
jgi:hypothetical protein